MASQVLEQQTRRIYSLVFEWKPGSFHKVDANIAGAMCSELEKDGRLTAENLVDINRPEDAPLHSEFDWIDTEAAEKWRRHQARHIINTLVMVSEGETKKQGVRAFFNIVTTSPNYESISSIVRHEDKYNSLMQTALRELRSFQKKYYSIKELQPVFDAIEEVTA